jgi:hypothetical protein
MHVDLLARAQQLAVFFACCLLPSSGLHLYMNSSSFAEETSARGRSGTCRAIPQGLFHPVGRILPH